MPEPSVFTNGSGRSRMTPIVTSNFPVTRSTVWPENSRFCSNFSFLSQIAFHWCSSSDKQISLERNYGGIHANEQNHWAYHSGHHCPFYRIWPGFCSKHYHRRMDG